MASSWGLYQLGVCMQPSDVAGALQQHEQESGLLTDYTSEDSLIPLDSTTHLIKPISQKPANKLENKRKTGWSQADLLQPPSKVYMTHVQKVLVLNSVAANSFMSQGKWDFWQCRKIYSLLCMKWKYCILQKTQPSNRQNQPDMFMNVAVVFFSVRGNVIITFKRVYSVSHSEASSTDSTLKWKLFPRIMT